MPNVDQSKQETTLDSLVEPRPGTDVGAHSASSEVIRVEKFSQSFLHRTLKRAVNLMFGVLCRRRFGSLGRNSRVNVPAWIKGHRSIHVGDNVHIWRSSRITAITSPVSYTHLTLPTTPYV